MTRIQRFSVAGQVIDLRWENLQDLLHYVTFYHVTSFRIDTETNSSSTLEASVTSIGATFRKRNALTLQ